MTQVTHMLVFFKVSIESILTLMLQTSVVLVSLVTQHLVISTMLLVTKVLHLMTLVYSTAHTFLYRWFVQLVRIHSNQKLASRLVTVWLRTHSLRELLRVMVLLQLTLTATTVVFPLLTLCKRDAYIFYKRLLLGVSFFMHK